MGIEMCMIHPLGTNISGYIHAINNGKNVQTKYKIERQTSRNVLPTKTSITQQPRIVRT